MTTVTSADKREGFRSASCGLKVPIAAWKAAYEDAGVDFNDFSTAILTVGDDDESDDDVFQGMDFDEDVKVTQQDLADNGDCYADLYCKSCEPKTAEVGDDEDIYDDDDEPDVVLGRALTPEIR
jgi:hypothetical protein